MLTAIILAVVNTAILLPEAGGANAGANAPLSRNLIVHQRSRMTGIVVPDRRRHSFDV